MSIHWSSSSSSSIIFKRAFDPHSDHLHQYSAIILHQFHVENFIIELPSHPQSWSASLVPSTNLHRNLDLRYASTKPHRIINTNWSFSSPHNESSYADDMERNDATSTRNCICNLAHDIINIVHNATASTIHVSNERCESERTRECEIGSIGMSDRDGWEVKPIRFCPEVKLIRFCPQRSWGKDLMGKDRRGKLRRHREFTSEGEEFPRNMMRHKSNPNFPFLCLNGLTVE